MLPNSKFKRDTVHINFECYLLENILLMNKLNFHIRIYSGSNLRTAGLLFNIKRQHIEKPSYLNSRLLSDI
jgi:hypothetical protein